MADEKISELTAATSVASPDVVPVVQGGVTKKADVSLFGSSDASLILNSTADANDSAFPFTADNAVIGIVDKNGVPVLNIFTGGTFETNDGSLYIGDSVPEGFQGTSQGGGTAGSQDNVAIGPSSMEAATVDSYSNTAVGVATLKNLTTGGNNIAVGASAGQTIEDGTNNIVIGVQTDVIEPSASNITLIGAQNDSDEGVTDNATAIGANCVVKQDNSVVIGNENVTDVYFGFTNANQTTGVLIVGNHYLIVAITAGADFTNVGASSNVAGEIFIATGTTPTSWGTDVNSKLALLDGVSILHGKGDAIVFPDADPHVVGAAYWQTGVLVRSAG